MCAVCGYAGGNCNIVMWNVVTDSCVFTKGMLYSMLIRVDSWTAKVFGFDRTNERTEKKECAHIVKKLEMLVCIGRWQSSNNGKKVCIFFCFQNHRNLLPHILSMIRRSFIPFARDFLVL